MNQNQRPHSRNKTIGAGSAGVGRGRKVSTGSGPVGSGGRSGNAHYTRRSGGGRGLGLKSILLIAVLLIGGFFLLKNGGGSLLSGLSDSTAHINDGDHSHTGEDYSTYTKPDYTVSDLARKKYVTPIGNGQDTVTIMVYMCGTDLESKYGMATKDLQEMMSAKLSGKVNLIVETGGCKKWQNSAISSAKNQIFKVENGGLKALEKNAGSKAMTDPQNLTDFIRYCNKHFPADRNMLIFWDHGGGSLTGYGYDEKNPNASSMTLSKINTALKAADCSFDFIGFDACLMATLETALVCSDHADYLIASEETEPGTGWYYKNWLTELSANTSASTVDVAQTIIDDFVSSCRASSGSAKVTLSVIDLAELDGTVPDSFRDFAVSTNEIIRSNDYEKVSDARAGVRQFSKENKLNQVDLIDLAQRMDTKEAKSLADALHGCVKYNKATMSRCNGVSIYFPYETTKNVKSAVASYKALGMDDAYTKCIQSFASLEYGGQIAASASQLPESTSTAGGDLLGTLISSYAGSGTSTSPIDVLLGSFTGGGTSCAGNAIDPAMLTSLLGSFSGRSMPAAYDWVDTELIAQKAEKLADDYLDPSHIVAAEKKGHNVLSLTDDEWGLVQTVELNVFVQDGDGFIDMGLDNTFDWQDDDLLLEYDGTWLTLNGKACAYYLVSDTEQPDGSWTTVGRIPALLNGEFVNLCVVFDKANPQGTVTGAYPLYADDAVSVQAKGNIEIRTGDKIELLCDFYDQNGEYTDSYTLGDPFTVPDSGLALVNLKLDAENATFTYRLTDIYGNHYWTPVMNK